MKRAKFKKAAICVCMSLTATALLILQLSGGGRVTATSSNEPMTDAVLSSRVIAEHAPVELVDRRDETTRVYEIVREVETTHPDGETSIDLVPSYVIEKSSGLCYRDENGNLRPANPGWEEWGGGFVLREACYDVATGRTLATPLSYTVKGVELLLRPAHLMASDGASTWDLAHLDTNVSGSVNPARPNVLTFAGAFGDGVDLELVADKDALHQNLVIWKPILQADANAWIYLYTDVSVDDFIRRSSGRINIAGQELSTSSMLTSAPAGEFNSMVFSVPDLTKGGYRPLHSFGWSLVKDSTPQGQGPLRVFAQRTLLHDDVRGIDYLVERIPASTLESAAYPVVWDWVSVPQSPVSGVWDPRYTYHVTGICSVASGETLTILPGTTVKFEEYKYINVPANSTIVAKGEPYNYITFTSSRDDNSGEDLTPGQATSGAPGDYGAAAFINYGASEFCVIQYAKMGYGVHGIYTEQTHEPIRHNIIRDFGYAGISLFPSSTSCQNNLIVRDGPPDATGIYCLALDPSCDISNNTIDGCSTGIHVYYNYQPIVTDNLLSRYDIGIYGSSLLTPNFNAYWHTVPGSQETAGGCQPGNDHVYLSEYENPYDDQSALGSHYLNAYGAYLLADAGSRDASEEDNAKPRLDLEVFAIRAPFTVSGMIYNDATWDKICYTAGGEPYAIDVGHVCIGYHHNRVDRSLSSDVTVSGSGVSLTIDPGVVVSMRCSPTQSRYLRVTSGATIVCEGMKRYPEYALVTRERPVSMEIESVRYPDSRSAFVKIESTASQSCRVGFTKFQWSSGLLCYASLATPMESNIFNLNYRGILNYWCENDFLDNLFHWNQFGMHVTRGRSAVTNCTFDVNGKGIYLYLRGSSQYHTVKNTLFTRNDYGIFVRDGASWLNETYNGFWANTANYRPGPIDPTDKDLGSDPAVKCPYEWLADDPADQFSTWYLKQDTDLMMDAGDGTVRANGLYSYTTQRWYEKYDNDPVDIGYHYWHHPDSDFDGLSDYWEERFGFDPADPDDSGSDRDYNEQWGDGLTNLEESRAGTDPNNWDTDGDSFPDGLEVRLPNVFENGPLEHDSDPPEGVTDVLYVDAGRGDDLNNGTHFSTPLQTIQEAVDRATVDGYIIFILPGIYMHHELECIDVTRATTLVGSGPFRSIVASEKQRAEGNGALLQLSSIPSSEFQTVIKDLAFEWRLNEDNEDPDIYQGKGGAILVSSCADVRIENCLITNNTADYGAGICQIESVATIERCVIAANGAISGMAGGGICTAGGYNGTPGANTTVTNCVICANMGGDGESDPSGGGGIYATSSRLKSETGLYPTLCRPEIANSLIAFNWARNNYGHGGGIRIYNCSLPSIRDCIVRDNQADYVGGGLHIMRDAAAAQDLYLGNCLISGNIAGNPGPVFVMAGGIYVSGLSGDDVFAINCDIVDNNESAVIRASTGVNFEILDSILWGNEVLLDSSESWAPNLVQYSDVEQPQGQTYPGTGNINAMPGFVFTPNGGYHLLHGGSPCIDSGDDAGSPSWDLDNDYRPLDGNGDGVAWRDMGTDEVNAFRVIVSIGRPELDADAVTLTWNSAQGAQYKIYVSNDLPGEGARWFEGALVPSGGNLTTWMDEEADSSQRPWRFYKVAQLTGGGDIDSDPVGFVGVPVRSDALAIRNSAFSIPLELKRQGLNEPEGPGAMITDALAREGEGEQPGSDMEAYADKIFILTEMNDWIPFAEEPPQTYRWLFNDPGLNPGDPGKYVWRTQSTYLQQEYSTPGIFIYVLPDYGGTEFVFLNQSLIGARVWVSDEANVDSAVVRDVTELSQPRRYRIELDSALGHGYAMWANVQFEAVDSLRRGESYVIEIRPRDTNPERIPLFGYVPQTPAEVVPFGHWLECNEGYKVVSGFAWPYPEVTTLNAIPFVRFGAFGASELVGRPDRILVWPVEEDGWKELWLRDDGIWMDGPLPADLRFVSVTPGSAFRFETCSEYPGDLREAEKPRSRKYMAIQRPYD